MISVGSNLASVRKHCAIYTGAPLSGSFYRTPLTSAMLPAPAYDAGIEVVFLHSGSTFQVLQFDDLANSGNVIKIREAGANIKGTITTVGSGGEKSVETPATVGHWYHALVHWQDSGAGTARIEFFLNGVSIGVTPYYNRNVWTAGAGSVLYLGTQGQDSSIALARLYKDTPPPPSELMHLPYIVKTMGGDYSHLKCQWTLRPGNGDTAVDTEGLFDLVWSAFNQPHALYSHYRYTGQCRADLWTPL